MVDGINSQTVAFQHLIEIKERWDCYLARGMVSEL